jgi:hypothetical protein
MSARFQKREVEPNEFKIRDTENEKWVGDGNGRRIRMNDEDRIDHIVDVLNERTEGD